MTYVQLTTTAFDLNELLQRKEALTTGGVVDRIAFTQADRLQRLFERIDGAIQNKKSLGSSFGPDHVLVVQACADQQLGALASSMAAQLARFGSASSQILADAPPCSIDDGSQRGFVM